MARCAILGGYLKECDIGGMYRKNMGEDEMRWLVLQELNQPTSHKRGMWKVWAALKSNGHHIKQWAISCLPDRTLSSASASEFVEKVMMDQSMDMPMRVEARLVSQSLHYLNTHLNLSLQLLGFDIFPPEGLAAGNSTLVLSDFDRGILGNGIGEDWTSLPHTPPHGMAPWLLHACPLAWTCPMGLGGTQNLMCDIPE